MNPLNVISVTLLVLYGVDLFLHLYAAKTKKEPLRHLTKTLLMLLLLGWYLLKAGSAPHLILVLIILLCWLGDVLLLGKSIRFFVAGGISFLLAHVCIVAAYWKQIDFGKIPPLLLIAAPLAVLTIVIILFVGLKKHLPKLLFYAMAFYLLINGIMNCFALWQLLSIPGIAALLAMMGAMSFFISDAMLFYYRFHPCLKGKPHTAVMITYALAVTLIVAGLTMIL